MAITVIGGLITSTLLTLVMIPAVYTIVDDVQSFLTQLPGRVRRLVSGRKPSSEPPDIRRAPIPFPPPVSNGSASTPGRPPIEPRAAP
jgi:hypothetical protein